MRIGEVADLSGTTTKTMRFYEGEGLLPAADRTSGGYRVYSQTLREIVAALGETATTGDPATCSPDQVCRYL